MDVEHWGHALAKLDYAFQPIVSIHSGVCLGYEALLRGWSDAGFESIKHVFDAAFEEKTLFLVESALREKAVARFVGIPFSERLKLFFNIDNRVLLMPDYSPVSTARILERYGLYPDTVVLELSEKHDLNSNLEITNASLVSYKRQTYKIALDDFGTGYSGLQLLFNTSPDFIKIDRFFIADMQADAKKRLFVSKVLSLAHTLGIKVIAEGVETDNEYYCCKDIGCDYIQGFLVQKPTTRIEELVEKHGHISQLSSSERRDRSLDHVLLHQEMAYLQPIRLHPSGTGHLTDMATVFDSFRKYKTYSFFPVINGNDAPVGLIRECELKEYVYSKYGKDLLLNRAAGPTLLDFVVKCPVADVNARIENIIELFAFDEVAEGVILTEDGRYAGFLTAKSLLRVINEKNIAVARDQNPLTRLPGNALIAEFLERSLDASSFSFVVSYFDLDHFKAFNDVYGFRQGDRAILLFADVLKQAAGTRECFIGHIGGDDFFAGSELGSPELNGEDLRRAVEWIRRIIDKFCRDVVSLYDAEDRSRGFVVSVDRDGQEKRFPLLSASAAVLHIPPYAPSCSTEQAGAIIARLKKEAKGSADRIAVATLGAVETSEPASVSRSSRA
jgi:EAL domain-containing protein (putative c-di-GMP-specific phosphodiesterase class I)/GGDEF domain-containing protein